jgi:hypothetical protein
MDPALCPCCQRWYKTDRVKRCAYCGAAGCRGAKPCKLPADPPVPSLAALGADLLNRYEAAGEQVAAESGDPLVDTANLRMELRFLRAEYARLTATQKET